MSSIDEKKVFELFNQKSKSVLNNLGSFDAKTPEGESDLYEIAKIVAYHAATNTIQLGSYESLHQTSEKLGVFLAQLATPHQKFASDLFQQYITQTDSNFIIVVDGKRKIESYAASIYQKNVFSLFPYQENYRNNEWPEIDQSIKLWFDMKEREVGIKLCKIAEDSHLSKLDDKFKKEVSSLMGQYAAREILTNPNSDNIKSVGEKVAIFLNSLDNRCVYNAITSLRDTLETSPNSLNHPVDNGFKLNFNVLDILVNSIGKNLITGTHQQTLLQTITDFHDEKNQKNLQKYLIQEDLIINEKLKSKEVMPEPVFNHIKEVKNSYQKLTELAQTLGIQIPQLSPNKNKSEITESVAELRKKMLETSNKNSNKPK